MSSPKTIAYSLMIGDLFHIGHLKMLESARKDVDYHICGIISDEIVLKWVPPLICSYKEREEVISKIKYVDETILQDSLDPTENLKAIHARYPEAKIMLVQNHILGGSSVLGAEYLKHIDGELIAHKFYSNLSRDFIKNAFIKDFVQNRDLKKISVSDIKFGDIDYFQKHFSTKANTIKSLRLVLKNAIIEKEFVFTVEQWETMEGAIIEAISDTFRDTTIVIRSSSLNEDSIDYSNAGHFESVLNVDSTSPLAITAAVAAVLDSYAKNGNYLKENQVLVQAQTQDVVISGVVFTRNLWSNTPYYLINYDDKSFKTDTVTSGLANSKVEILKDLPLEKVNARWYNLISAVHEIELFFRGLTLDIEFAIKKNGEVVIFQVRPLAANTRFYSLDDDLIKQKISRLQQQYHSLAPTNGSGDHSPEAGPVLSDMAFWNPAELIGDRPNYLDYSLFNHLLMKTNWNEALLPLGYTNVDEPLMTLVGNKPYINVHHAFLSLLPETLDAGLKQKLLAFYAAKLRNNPELHDKVEFEIVHNCYGFDFDRRAEELRAHNFSSDEIASLKHHLACLTNDILGSYERVVEHDKADIARLEQSFLRLQSLADRRNGQSTPQWREQLDVIYELVEDCKRLGTTQFARVARMAFIGSALLKSLRDTNVLSCRDYNDVMNSITTVATEMDDDVAMLRERTFPIETFIVKYGHLRPGTYDITKLPYHKNISYIWSESGQANGRATAAGTDRKNGTRRSFDEIRQKLSPCITQACVGQNIRAQGSDVLNFIRTAIELREYFKFIYTKNISLAIELIAEIGSDFGFTREQLSNLDYYSIVNGRAFCSKDEIINTWQNLINGRMEEKRIEAQVSLPPIIFSDQDFVMVPTYITKPNFITGAMIEGDTVLLDKLAEESTLEGKIVVIEKADPGYDWIFTKNIKGLVTKYGGAASHMAIRCAEFRIPAAIGCGDIIYSQVCNSPRLVIDCKNRTIHTL